MLLFALCMLLLLLLLPCMCQEVAAVEEESRSKSENGCDVDEVLQELREDFLQGVVRWRHCLQQQKGSLAQFQAFKAVEKVVKEALASDRENARKVIEVFREETTQIRFLFGEKSLEFVKSNSALAFVLKKHDDDGLAAAAYERKLGHFGGNRSQKSRVS